MFQKLSLIAPLAVKLQHVMNSTVASESLSPPWWQLIMHPVGHVASVMIDPQLRFLQQHRLLSRDPAQCWLWPREQWEWGTKLHRSLLARILLALQFQTNSQKASKKLGRASAATDRPLPSRFS